MSLTNKLVYNKKKTKKKKKTVYITVILLKKAMIEPMRILLFLGYIILFLPPEAEAHDVSLYGPVNCENGLQIQC